MKGREFVAAAGEDPRRPLGISQQGSADRDEVELVAFHVQVGALELGKLEPPGGAAESVGAITTRLGSVRRPREKGRTRMSLARSRGFVGIGVRFR